MVPHDSKSDLSLNKSVSNKYLCTYVISYDYIRHLSEFLTPLPALHVYLEPYSTKIPDFCAKKIDL